MLRAGHTLVFRCGLTPARASTAFACSRTMTIKAAKADDMLSGWRVSRGGTISAFNMTRRTLFEQLSDDLRYQDLRLLLPQPTTLPSVLVRNSSVLLSLTHAKVILLQNQVLVFVRDTSREPQSGSANPNQPQTPFLVSLLSNRLIQNELALTIESLTKSVDKTISEVDVDMPSKTTATTKETITFLARDQAQAASNSMVSIEASDIKGAEFELVVLDVLLEYVTKRLAREMRILTFMVDSVLEDLERSVISQSSVQMLIPATRSLKHFDQVLQSLNECITELLSSDEDMANMRLTAKQQGEILSSDHAEVEILLEVYRQRIREIIAECHYSIDAIDEFKAMLEIRLDIHRNQVIRMNFHVGVATLGFGASAFGAGVFGMNFPFSGFQNADAFWPTTAAIGAAGAFVWIAWMIAFRLSQSSEFKNHTFVAFSNLLTEVENIGAAVQSLDGDTSRPSIEQQLKRAIPYRQLTKHELNLISQFVVKDRLRKRRITTTTS